MNVDAHFILGPAIYDIKEAIVNLFGFISWEGLVKLQKSVVKFKMINPKVGPMSVNPRTTEPRGYWSTFPLVVSFVGELAKILSLVSYHLQH